MLKTCNLCKKAWESEHEFLTDPAITLIGYQVNFKELEFGFLLFNHDCKTTLAIPVETFRYLYDGPVFQERRTGFSDCPEYCLYKSELRQCPVKCECAWVREIIQVIRNYK